MMRHLPVLPLLALLAGCDAGPKHLPDAVGGQGEVLVVMAKGHWEGAPGAAVRSVLEQAVQGLPQREARFKLAQTTPENFGSLLTAHHSVLLAVIGAEADTTAMTRQRDPFARGQLVVRVSSPDPVTWTRTLQQRGDDLATAIEEHQRARVGARLKKERDAALASGLKAWHGIDMDVPGGYRVMKQDSGFTWLQRDRIVSGSGLDHNVIEGLLVHTHPHVSDDTFTVPFLIGQRDTVTERYVEGPNAGSHMVTQRAFEDLDLMPGGRATRVDGRFAYLMHGLFGMRGAKMGGPFVSLTTVDEERGRVVTVEGFVYAPQFDKREYVRELEAVLFSLRIVPIASP